MQFNEYGRRGGRIGPPEAPVGWHNGNYWRGVSARRRARESLYALLSLPLPLEVRRRLIREWRRDNLNLVRVSREWRRRYR